MNRGPSGTILSAPPVGGTAQRLAQIFKEDRERIQSLGRISGSALRVHDALQQHPIQTIATVKDRTALSVPTVTAAIRSLEAAGIVRELTGKQRGREFGYGRYLDVLNEGTTTPPQS